MRKTTGVGGHRPTTNAALARSLAMRSALLDDHVGLREIGRSDDGETVYLIDRDDQRCSASVEVWQQYKSKSVSSWETKIFEYVSDVDAYKQGFDGGRFGDDDDVTEISYGPSAMLVMLLFGPLALVVGVATGTLPEVLAVLAVLLVIGIVVSRRTRRASRSHESPWETVEEERLAKLREAYATGDMSIETLDICTGQVLRGEVVTMPDGRAASWESPFEIDPPNRKIRITKEWK